MKINICSRQSKANSSRSIRPSQATRKLGKIHETAENWDCGTVICERRNNWGDCFLLGGAFWTGAEGGGPERQQQLMGVKGEVGFGNTEVAWVEVLYYREESHVGTKSSRNQLEGLGRLLLNTRQHKVMLHRVG